MKSAYFAFAGIVGALLLSGCQTPAESMSIAACQRLGLKPGTYAFVQCYQQERDRRARIGIALIRAGGLIAAADALRPPAPRPVSVHCVKMGTMVSCSGM